MLFDVAIKDAEIYVDSGTVVLRNAFISGIFRTVMHHGQIDAMLSFFGENDK